MTTAPRETARYRTKTSALAAPVAGAIGVPILCDMRTVEVPSTSQTGFWAGEPFEFEIINKQSILLTGTFRVAVTHGDPDLGYAYRVEAYWEPTLPLGASGSFQEPKSAGRIVTHPYEATGGGSNAVTLPWTCVLARDPGLISLTPIVSVNTESHSERDGPVFEGTINYIETTSYLAAVIGTFADDECTQWGSSA